MKILFFVFVLLPILELALLIKVGSLIGVLPTILLVFLTAAIGMALLRKQGFATLAKATSKLESGQIPLHELVEAVFLAVGGALLLAPGFITDLLGLACLTPGLRQVLLTKAFKLLRSGRVNYQASFHYQGRRGRRPSDQHTTIDGEYTTEPPGEQAKIEVKKR